MYLSLIFGILSFSFSFLKKPRKDWFIVFFLKGFLSSLIAKVAVSNRWLEFPFRLFPKVYKISIVFDYLIFPLACVWYNQTTYSSKLKGILFQAIFLYSLPMTIFEYWLERNTKLIKYNNWTWFHTLLSLSFTFLFVRGFMGFIRKFSVQETPQIKTNSSET